MERAWLREFNSLGLQLRPQAAKVVTSFLRECDNANETVERLVDETKVYMRNRSGVVESVIDETAIRAVIECCMKAQEGAATNAEEMQDAVQTKTLELGDGVHVYNVLRDVKPYNFNRATKVWTPSQHESTFFAGPDAKAKIYSDRYHILLQRLFLEGKLIPEAQAVSGALLPGQRILTPVESLVGNPGRKLTFGLLSMQHSELNAKRHWVIEDIHKVFPVELHVSESAHLMTDGSFVLAEGEVVGDSFKVYSLDVASAVPRKLSLEEDQVPLQAFGGNLTEEQLQTLEQCEPQYPDGMYIVLSEVHLDSVRVLEKLEDLFRGYEEAGPPAAYVLMGSFCSRTFVPTAEGVRDYRDGFERLKFMMRSLEAHIRANTRFIFIPGPQDPGPETLPRVPLPNYLTSDLAQEFPNVVMASNPCRVRHFSRELVFFRHDVLRLLRRHEAVPLSQPNPREVVPGVEHVHVEMTRFLLDQAHLVPLPLEESNVLWEYDHTLRLYPLPTAVFVGGLTQAFESIHEECQFCSVGSFSRDARFYAYYPVKEQLDECEVPDRAG